ncbi:ComEC/Rec2 family competence protein [Kutzneria albida]|uniref:DNA internalization-related competence protein ComEC/Rec2 n=1 Tax=Kutzneria albida DSM 43870 TaxID=1449976 RepID=W5W1E3_9PSEU|nr:ComEC/Rec2 family competence protein [Kutzneria albida]AHH95003.1 DNA internalization-related competence protein ComEC/Rec2 [Kutzneria albida DSM 43870]
MIRQTPVIPAALAVWAMAAAGLLFGWPCAALIGGCAVAGGVLAAIRSLRWRPAAVLLVLVGALAACWITLVLRDSESHPLRAEAEHGAVRTLRVEVADRPHPLRTAGFGGRQGGADRVALPVRGAGADLLVLAPVRHWGELLPGQLVTVSGRLAPAKPHELTVAVVQARGDPADPTPAPIWQQAAGWLRAGLRQAATVLPAEPAGLLPGLVVGDTSGLSPRVAEEFATSGMTHLLAVSGANLAIVAGAVLFGLRLLGLGPVVCGLGAGLAMAGFVVLAGPQPSVLRAAVMGGIGLLGLVLGRPRSALPALAWTVVVLVPLDPGLALNAGFALSALATGGLVLIAPRWADRLRAKGVPPGLAEVLVAPLAAHLVTAPVIAGLSGEVSLVAVLANLVAEPVVAPATVLSVLATLAMPVHHGAAELLVHAAGPEASWLVLVGRHAAATPLATLRWPGGWVGGLVLVAAIGAAVLVVRSPRARALAAAVLVGAGVVLLPTRLTGAGWPPTGWSAVACDVGQGDALVVATGDPSRAVLVDTGPDLSAVIGCLRRLGVHRLPLVLISHLHADHIGGLASVLADYQVGAVGVGPLHEPGWAWQQVNRDAASAGVPIVDLALGQRWEWPGLTMEVLAPREVPSTLGRDPAGTPINDASVVVRASTPAGRVLLSGDVELSGQAALLASGQDLSAEVLKVPHHGSRYSLPRFLERVHPSVAVVSVGAGNTFGHPSPLVLDALTRGGTTVLRTDQDGDLAVLPGSDHPHLARRGEPRAPPH